MWIHDVLMKLCLSRLQAFVWIVFVFVSLFHDSLGSDAEMRLVDQLFDGKGYNPLIRPVRNISEAVEVKFGLAYVQLISVDERKQVLKSNVWLRMSWLDYQFVWDPADYSGITVIRIDPSKVWKPDLVLFNNADGHYEVSWEPNVLIYYYGSVIWIPPALYQSEAQIDVKYFPFDEQKCIMKFGSWTYNAHEVYLGWYEGVDKVDLGDYMFSGSWDIIRCPGIIVKFNDTAGVLQEQIHWVITIRRKTLFYTVNLIVPCVLISFLTICVFYLPTDAGEKVTLSISVLLALVVFLLLVSKILPATSLVIPLISKFLIFAFLMNIFAIFITVVTINWSFRTPRTHIMPHWARVVFLNYLPRIVRMKRPDHDNRWQPKMSNKHKPNPTADGTRNFNLNAQTDRMQQAGRTGIHRNNRNHISTQSLTPLNPEIQRTMDGIRFIYEHIKSEDEISTVDEDWMYIALVIDRLQLWIFLIVTIGGAAGILLDVPHIFDYIDQQEIIDQQ